MQILEIFPEVVYQENLSISSYDISEIKFDKNGYSITDVLNLKQFADIKKQIEKHVEKFTHDVLGISTELSFYVTRSWIIKLSNQDLTSRFHNHTNSFFTGVLYLDLDEDQDSIIFSRGSDYQYLEYDYEKPNLYNQKRLSFFPRKNDLIMFDAKLYHQIGPHLTDNTRICLAFEVFARGTFGKKNTSLDYNNGALTLK